MVSSKMVLMPYDPTLHPHIRAIRIKQDLQKIADLIDICFSPNMDADGREYLKQIRQTANNFGYWIPEDSTPETSTLPFHGYVWIEDNRLVGNLTLIPIRRKEKGIYFIANVAVHPDYRGRGIAKELTDRALKHIHEHDGKQVYLQVRDDNPAAIHIYQSQGFEEIARRTTWIFGSGNQPQLMRDPGIKITMRRKEDWAQQKLWFQTLYPPEISWNLPFRMNRFEPTFSNWITRFLNGDYQKCWAVRNQSGLMGVITLNRTNEAYDYLWVATSPALEAQTLQTALPVIHQRVWAPFRIALNYPAGRAIETFKASGMKELHTLIWMKMAL
jgi:ribosomal protein S18 acetylase RimI-like enzyme